MIKEYVSNPAKLALDIKKLVLSGEVNPLIVKVIHDAFNEAMKDKTIKDAIMSEVDKYPEKEFEIAMFKFMKMNRASYDFKHDAVWQELEAKKKAREALMKQAIDSEIADATTGEVVPPAIKKNSEYIKKI